MVSLADNIRRWGYTWVKTGGLGYQRWVKSATNLELTLNSLTG